MPDQKLEKYSLQTEFLLLPDCPKISRNKVLNCSLAGTLNQYTVNKEYARKLKLMVKAHHCCQTNCKANNTLYVKDQLVAPCL